MKPFRLVVLAALFIGGITSCWGKLGETEAECIARYGPEFDVQDSLAFDVIGDKAASFNWKTAYGSFLIHVTFLNGVDALEKMTNADDSVDMTDEAKRAILDAESAGFRWSKTTSAYRTDRSDVTTATERWLRDDGATAVCYMSGKLKTEHSWGEIDLSTREYAAAQRELDRQNGVR